jgi:kumamolisin
MAASGRFAIPGSERFALPGATRGAPADPGERVEVSILVRRRPGYSIDDELRENELRPPGRRHYLTHEEFEDRYGADPEDIRQVEAFAAEQGLDILETSLGRRTVRVAGTVAAMSEAFGTALHRYDFPGGSYRGREGPVFVPAQISGIVEAVLGLDNRPQLRPHFRTIEVDPDVDPAAAFQTPAVATLYRFPTGTGQGQCVGIIELGGGYTNTDLQTYFNSIGVTPPQVLSVSVDGGKNAPGDPADVEVALDIEVVGAVAPAATIAVYFAPNTDQGFVDAVSAAVHDQVNNPSVISISWGNAESLWTTQGMQSLQTAFQDAASLGVTVCCASGDGGSGDGVTDGLAHADYPASSPSVLGCGGTHLEGSSATITSEVVWNSSIGASGGGVSDAFGLPSWQASAGVPPSANPGGHVGRGVPDVAGDADPATGYDIFVTGKSSVVGGTSAVAPLWAGLVALLNEALGHRLGFLNPFLYRPGAQSGFFDITAGSNGAYQAGPGWDPCTGLGSPNGTALAADLKGLGA